MSYLKNNFQDGNILNANQLNNMDTQIKENEENINQLSNSFNDLKEDSKEALKYIKEILSPHNIFDGIWIDGFHDMNSLTRWHSKLIEIPNNATTLYFQSKSTCNSISFARAYFYNEDIQPITNENSKHLYTTALKSFPRVYSFSELEEKPKYFCIVAFSGDGYNKPISYDDLKNNFFVYASFAPFESGKVFTDYPYVINSISDDDGISSLKYSVLTNSRTGFFNALEIGFKPYDETFDNGDYYNKVYKIYRNIYFPEGIWFFKTPIVISNIGKISIKGLFEADFSSSSVAFSNWYDGLAYEKDMSYSNGTVFSYIGPSCDAFITIGTDALHVNISDLSIDGNAYAQEIYKLKESESLGEFVHSENSTKTFRIKERIDTTRTVGGVHVAYGAASIHRVLFTGWSDYALKTDFTNQRLNDLSFNNCNIAIIADKYDHFYHNMIFRNCGNAITFTGGKNNVDDYIFFKLTNCFFDTIARNAIDLPYASSNMVASSVNADSIGGDFLHSVRKVQGVFQGRIHRTNWSAITEHTGEERVAAGAFHGEKGVYLNAITDAEDVMRYGKGDPWRDEAYVVYADNGSYGCFITAKNRPWIYPEDAEGVFAINNGIKI